MSRASGQGNLVTGGRRHAPSWRGRGALSLVILVPLLLVLSGGSAALAQVDPFAWIEQLFKPKPPPAAVGKPQPDIHRAPASKPTARPKRTARPIDKAPDKPAVTPTFFVAVLGDSLGQLLGQGLTEALTDRPDVAVLRKAKENSGLVRDDFYDWTKATRDLVESKERIDFAIVMIGSNDRQALRDAEGSHEPRSPEWLDAYARRIEAIATLFRDKKISLVWVGLPVMKSERLSADALAFNELYRTHAAKAGATYVDIWEAFADEAGAYDASGPDIDGQIVRLRAADGVHFTRAGARKLAHFIEPELRRRLGEVAPPAGSVTPDLAIPAMGPGGAPPASGAPEESPPIKPIAGPILPLTGTPLAPGGDLATRLEPPRGQTDPARDLIDRTLSRGQPLDPKPGRADDFAWPRP